jgi:hypothetical protein
MVNIRSSSRFICFVLSALVFTVLAACAPAPTATPEVYQRISEGTLNAGDAIPVPTENVVLTVTGKIGAANSGESIEMDMPTIESVGLVDLRVHDPFDDKDVTFEGVLMSDLLALWKVPDDATNLDMIALNDYVVNVPISDIQSYPVIFAIKADGEYMPVSTRGPAMLVYPYGHFDFDQQIYNDRWIWQIKSINVQ